MRPLQEVIVGEEADAPPEDARVFYTFMRQAYAQYWRLPFFYVKRRWGSALGCEEWCTCLGCKSRLNLQDYVIGESCDLFTVIIDDVATGVERITTLLYLMYDKSIDVLSTSIG